MKERPNKQQLTAHICFAPVGRSRLRHVFTFADIAVKTSYMRVTVEEVKQKKTPETLALENALNNWLNTFDDVPNALMISLIISEDIKRGEVDVIAKPHQLLGAEHDVIAVLDDKSARKGAQALSIPVTGTLGMVVHAVRSGNVTPDQGIAIMNELIYAGARLDPLLIRETLENMHSR